MISSFTCELLIRKLNKHINCYVVHLSMLHQFNLDTLYQSNIGQHKLN